MLLPHQYLQRRPTHHGDRQRCLICRLRGVEPHRVYSCVLHSLVAGLLDCSHVYRLLFFPAAVESHLWMCFSLLIHPATEARSFFSHLRFFWIKLL